MCVLMTPSVIRWCFISARRPPTVAHLLDRVSRTTFTSLVLTEVSQRAFETIDTMARRVALLVVDMQEDFCPPVQTLISLPKPP